jgi:hypothetical protein
MAAIAVLLHAACGIWKAATGVQDTSSGPGNSSCKGTNAQSSKHSQAGSVNSTVSSGKGGGAPPTSAAGDSSGSSQGSGRGQSSGSAGCGPGTMRVLSSLTVSVASAVHAEHSLCSDGPGPGSLWTVRPCSLIAADMMHLAAHHVQQQGADWLGATGLAAAAQRLAAACAELAQKALRRLPPEPAAKGRCSAQESWQPQQHQTEAPTPPTPRRSSSRYSTESSSRLRAKRQTTAAM